MEQGVRTAVVLAAIVCLMGGLVWDRVVRVVVEPEPLAAADSMGNGGASAMADASAGTSSPRPRSTVDFHFATHLPPPRLPARTPAQQSVSGANQAPRVVPVSAAVISPVPVAERPAEQPKVQAYTVRSGDLLSAISKKFYGTERHWQFLMTANGIRDPHALRPGQVLKIPARPDAD